MSVDVRDHSLNLANEPDERDEGYGIERLADGKIRQRDADEDRADPEDESVG